MAKAGKSFAVLSGKIAACAPKSLEFNGKHAKLTTITVMAAVTKMLTFLVFTIDCFSAFFFSNMFSLATRNGDNRSIVFFLLPSMLYEMSILIDD